MKTLFTRLIPAVCLGAVLHWGYQSYSNYKQLELAAPSDLVEATPAEISPLGYGEDFPILSGLMQLMLVGPFYEDVKDPEAHLREAHQNGMAAYLSRLRDSLPGCQEMTILHTNGIVRGWSGTAYNMTFYSEIQKMLKTGKYDRKIVVTDDYIKAKDGKTYCESVQAIFYNKATQKGRVSTSDKPVENEDLVGYLYLVTEDRVAKMQNVEVERKAKKPFFVVWE